MELGNKILIPTKRAGINLKNNYHQQIPHVIELEFYI
jgi:hypothetical protein